jgi:hypothetical protein
MSIIVTRSNGTSDITFTLQQSNGNQRVYVNAAAGATEPERIVMQSFLRPTGAKGTDKYLLLAEKVYIEDTTGNTILVRAKLELSVPRSTESGLATSVADQCAFLKSLLTGTNITAMIAGVLPADGGDYHVDTFNPA